MIYVILPLQLNVLELDDHANLRIILCATMLPHYTLSCVITPVWPGLNAISKEYM